MAAFYVQVDQQEVVSKTVNESDVYLFAGITSDLSSNHVNEQVMAASAYGGRIAHGALLVGFISAASTRMIETYGTPPNGEATAVSLGYDRIRFLRLVYIGDTVTAYYRIASVGASRRRSLAHIVVRNQQGEDVAVAEHILKWIPTQTSEDSALQAPPPHTARFRRLPIRVCGRSAGFSQKRLYRFIAVCRVCPWRRAGHRAQADDRLVRASNRLLRAGHDLASQRDGILRGVFGSGCEGMGHRRSARSEGEERLQVTQGGAGPM